MKLKSVSIYRRIYHEVMNILNENNYKLVYITLLGSRGFGKYRDDSDYDVKVIYLPSLRSMIELDEVRDTFRVDKVINDGAVCGVFKLDIEFMSLRHFCKLIAKSNYTPYEWLLGGSLMSDCGRMPDADIENYKLSEKTMIPKLVELMSNNLKSIAILHSIKSILNNLVFKEGDDNWLLNHLSDIQTMLRLINIVSYYREYGQFTFNHSDVVVYRHNEYDNDAGETNIPKYICSPIDSFVDEFNSGLFKTYVIKLYDYALSGGRLQKGDDIYKITTSVKTAFNEYIEHLINITLPTHRPNRVSSLTVNDFYIDYVGKKLGIQDNLNK